VLVDCPDLRGIRRELRKEVGDAFSSVSRPLGGSTEGKKGKPDTISRVKTVKAVLDFAEASHWFGVVRREGSLTMGTAIGPR
jgi:hypothetical protein